MAYNGTMENKHFNGTSYFIVSGRNSEGNVEHVFQNAERNPMKTQTIRLVFKLLYKLSGAIRVASSPGENHYHFENLTKLSRFWKENDFHWKWKWCFDDHNFWSMLVIPIGKNSRKTLLSIKFSGKNSPTCNSKINSGYLYTKSNRLCLYF